MAKDNDTGVDKSGISKIYQNHNWLYGLIAALIIIMAFISGAGAANHHRQKQVGFLGNEKGLPFEGHRAGFMPMGGHMRHSGSVTINGQTRTTGVVTSVSGANFTIAGNGSTTNVTTSSSTQYRDGNQVKQNDTVIVFGTTTDGSLNATQIAINP